MAEPKKEKGNLLESREESRVYAGFPYNLYEVMPPRLSEEDLRKAELLIKVISRSASLKSLLSKIGQKNEAIVEQFRNSVIHFIDLNDLLRKLPSAKQMEILRLNLLPVSGKLEVKDKTRFITFVIDNSIGYGLISTLMSDPNLEEIMVNGADRNIFVFHRQFGNCRTNLVVDESSEIPALIRRVSQTAGRQFNEAHPLLDARLPDGSRANATFDYVSPFGQTLTIRKFSRIPLSIIDLIANETMSSEIAAFLWVMTHGFGFHPMNTVITGGTGSGKTTLMNILATFIPFNERVVSIEDTVELDLGIRENWIQMESKPKIKDILAVSMDDLLKNTLRMRPDRILVGEVRGIEAQTLFVAMDTGHRGILGTVHSNSAREMMLRLKSAPMEVPEQMLPLLDMVVVMQRHYDRQRGIIRRIRQIAEVDRMDEKVLLNNVYELDERTGRGRRSEVPSSLIERLASNSGMTKNELKREIGIRKKVLEFLLAQGIRDREQVERTVQQYYFDPGSVLKLVSEAVE